MLLVIEAVVLHNASMLDAKTVEGIESKFNALVGDLDERGRRRWAAAEAMALGRGGVTIVASATRGFANRPEARAIDRINRRLTGRIGDSQDNV